MTLLFDRLLREMGWNEADQEEYEITEDEKKEFQNLTKQVTCIGLQIIWASTQQNVSSGFPTNRDSNQSLQLQRLSRRLKFRVKQVEI